MNIFIGENNLKDYVFLKSIIEKWGIEKQQEIYFHWYKQLYYQLPKCLKNCDLVFLELDMKHINGFEFAKILRKKDLSIPIVFQTKNTHYGIASYQVQAMHYLKYLIAFYYINILRNLFISLKKKFTKYLMKTLFI